MLLSRRGIRGGGLAAAALVSLVSTSSAGAQIARVQKAKLALDAPAREVVAGAELKLEARATVETGWHVQAHVPSYDYLIPTALTFELPDGWAAPSIEYPKPVRYRFAFVPEEIDVYEGEIRMPVLARVPADAAPGPVTLAAKLRYQACDDKSCLPPVDATASIEVTVVAASAKSELKSKKQTDEKHSSKGTTEQAEPPASASSAGTARLAEEGVEVSATPDPRGSAGAPSGGATSDAASAGSSTATDIATAPAAQPPAPSTATAASPRADSRSLAGILLLALLGGLILNGMPCVLPIVSLKVFGLVKSAGAGRGSVRAGALATAAGILISFWALAAAAIAARSAGTAIGWGIQFQQPGFVAFLALVILLFSLNLWGLFEIPLPGAVARLADSAGDSGLGGSFASGLFATLMATPCSAPFLGTALSFALGQSAGVIFATLTAVGVGLALPYLVLWAAPGAVRFLPKPGAWMDTLRGAMGFLLAGALVWLLYVLAAQVAAESVALFELALLFVALAVWSAARAPLESTRRRFGWVVAFSAAVGSVFLVMDAPAAAAKGVGAADASSISWRPFDRGEAERLAAAGRLVFLDVTADWCVTCKVNERVILNTPEVIELFRRLDVVAMKADWTNRDDEISRFLADHGRYGIPFYLLYRPGAEPHLFGELITRQEVIDVLSAAGAGRS